MRIGQLLVGAARPGGTRPRESPGPDFEWCSRRGCTSGCNINSPADSATLSLPGIAATAGYQKMKSQLVMLCSEDPPGRVRVIRLINARRHYDSDCIVQPVTRRGTRPVTETLPGQWLSSVLRPRLTKAHGENHCVKPRALRQADTVQISLSPKHGCFGPVTIRGSKVASDGPGCRLGIRIR